MWGTWDPTQGLKESSVNETILLRGDFHVFSFGSAEGKALELRLRHFQFS